MARRKGTSLQGRRVVGTVEDELGNGRVLLVKSEEMNESQFVLDAKHIWKLKQLLEFVGRPQTSGVSSEMKKDADDILETLKENVLSGAKGSNRS